MIRGEFGVVGAVDRVEHVPESDDIQIRAGIDLLKRALEYLLTRSALFSFDRRENPVFASPADEWDCYILRDRAARLRLDLLDRVEAQ